MKDPILARTEIAANRHGERVATVFYVQGGLHYLKGNKAPYFSLTYERHRKGFPKHCWSGGAGHDLILKLFPRFADLAKLHLSDIDGEPMHALENGFYNLAGALGGLGQPYHVGNSKRHFPKAEVDPAKPWATTDYREPTRSEAMQIFADHLRVSLEEAREIAKRCAPLGIPPEEIKQRLSSVVDELRPRWKAEAEACISNHGLKVYGDAWTPAETAKA
jgi:hypothetical protein